MIKLVHLGTDYSNSIQTAVQSLRDRIASMGQPFISQYAYVIAGCEKFINTDLVIPVVSKTRVPWSSVISEYSDGKILYNPRKYRLMREWEIAGNLAHEALHALKFTHTYDYNPDRKYTVPYFIGYWVEYYLSKLKLGIKPNFNEFLIELQRRT